MTFSSVREVEPDYEIVPLDRLFPLSAKDRPVRPAPPLSSLELVEHRYRTFGKPKPSTRQAAILTAIEREPLTAVAIAEATGLELGNVMTGVGELKRRGLVQRVRFQDRQAIYGRRG